MTNTAYHLIRHYILNSLAFSNYDLSYIQKYGQWPTCVQDQLLALRLLDEAHND